MNQIVIDHFTEQRSYMGSLSAVFRESFRWIPMAVVSLILVQMVLGLLRNWMQMRKSLRVSHHLMERYSEKIHHVPLHDLENYQTGDLIRRILNGIFFGYPEMTWQEKQALNDLKSLK